MNIGMFFQKRFHSVALMGRRPVPDQDKRTFDLTHKMFQSNQQLLGIDRTFKMSFVDLARNRQADHRGDFSAKFGDPFQSRSLSLWRPGETDRLCKGKSKFIFTHDLCAETPRFFILGKYRLNQARTNSSSCSIALGSTFCTLQPSSSNKRLM